jgi:hypothetical protein
MTEARIPSPIRATGSHFYKYSSLEHPEWLKKIVLDHELYVPTVSQLNDPADGRPLLTPLSEEKMFEFLYNANRNPTLSLSAQQQVFDVLRFNIKHHGPDALQREMAKIFYKHLAGHRIYSLSQRWDNLSMWAKYANGHTGYCLEFARQGPFFERAVKVIYGESVPMDVTNPEQRRAYFLYCKRPEWSDEEEVRMVQLRGSGSSTLKIDPHWLTRLILGMHVTETHEKAIRDWALQREPQLVVVKAYFDELFQKLLIRE